MRSWVLLLLLSALSAARLRLGSAEGDPLPPSLVDLVRNSPIASVDELKVLLLQEANAIEEEEDEHDFLTNHTHGRYSRSLVEAQQAQLAVCKVRTEVMEVTRSMLDRRNADFILWPPCVEVQRCSGCCNTRHLQCTPTVTSSRYLKVLKIQFIRSQPHYTNAMISVEDHVSCRCLPATSSSSSSSSSSLPVTNSPVPSNPDPPPPPPPPQQPAPSSHLPLPLPRSVHPAPPKSHSSKADLHRHDDLKHNQQRYHSEEREPAARQWQQGSYTQLVHWTQPRVHQGPAHQPIAGVLGGGGSWPSEARAEHSVMGSTQPLGGGSGSEGSREEGSVASNTEGHHPDHAQRQQQVLQHQQRQQHQQQYPHHPQPHYPQPYNHGGAEELRTQHRLHSPQSDSASPPVSPTHPPASEQNPTLPLTTNQRDSVTSHIITQVTKQTETEAVSQRGGSEKEESGSANSGDSAAAEPANQGRERDSKPTVDLTEEERRLRLLEMVQSEPDKQTHLHPHPPHPPQQRPKTTTFITVVSTVAPVSSPARQAPFRPASPRRRRKHRKRISKAALRAMIM